MAMIQSSIPPLYAIANVDEPECRESYFEDLWCAGVEWIQIRAKHLSNSKLVALSRWAVEQISGDLQKRIIINDFVDVCRKSDAHGVHLGQGDTSIAEARKLLGGEAIIGHSTHNLEQLRVAPFAQLSYLALGPIYQSATKYGHAPQVGLEQLSLAASVSPLPLVAIGGITAEAAIPVYAAGAASIACIQELRLSRDLAATVEKFLEAFRRSRKRQPTNAV